MPRSNRRNRLVNPRPRNRGLSHAPGGEAMRVAPDLWPWAIVLFISGIVLGVFAGKT